MKLNSYNINTMKSNSIGAGLYIINKIYKCNYMLKIEKKKKMGGVKLKKKWLYHHLSKKLSTDDIRDLIIIKKKRQKYEQELLWLEYRNKVKFSIRNYIRIKLIRLILFLLKYQKNIIENK